MTSDDLFVPLERVPCVELGGTGLIDSKSLAAEESSTKHRAQIVGKVEYRQGEGILFAIPLGAADVEVTALDTTFSWTEGNFHGVAAMPIAVFCRYITEGAIDLDRQTFIPFDRR